MADYWGIMEARGEGDIRNLDYLTMFADYRVPQALVYLGALRYSDALMEALKKGKGAVCYVCMLTILVPCNCNCHKSVTVLWHL